MFPVPACVLPHARDVQWSCRIPRTTAATARPAAHCPSRWDPRSAAVLRTFAAFPACCAHHSARCIASIRALAFVAGATMSRGARYLCHMQALYCACVLMPTCTLCAPAGGSSVEPFSARGRKIRTLRTGGAFGAFSPLAGANCGRHVHALPLHRRLEPPLPVQVLQRASKLGSRGGGLCECHRDAAFACAEILPAIHARSNSCKGLASSTCPSRHRIARAPTAS